MGGERGKEITRRELDRLFPPKGRPRGYRTTDKSPCALYRYFDADGNLLYVGVSKDPEARLRSHEKHSEWFPQAQNVKWHWFPTRPDALAAEWEAINAENPRYNVARDVSYVDAEFWNMTLEDSRIDDEWEATRWPP